MGFFEDSLMRKGVLSGACNRCNPIFDRWNRSTAAVDSLGGPLMRVSMNECWTSTDAHTPMRRAYTRWRYGKRRLETNIQAVDCGLSEVAGSWRFKESIEERMEAFKEEQELENRASVAERFLSPPSEETRP